MKSRLDWGAAALSGGSFLCPEETPAPLRPVGMQRLRRWTDWYEFAREALDYAPGEAEAYARIRYAEELNRRKLEADARRTGVRGTRPAPRAATAP
jgi:hypothetical protein